MSKEKAEQILNKITCNEMREITYEIALQAMIEYHACQSQEENIESKKQLIIDFLRWGRSHSGFLTDRFENLANHFFNKPLHKPPIK